MNLFNKRLKDNTKCVKLNGIEKSKLESKRSQYSQGDLNSGRWLFMPRQNNSMIELRSIYNQKGQKIANSSWPFSKRIGRKFILVKKRPQGTNWDLKNKFFSISHNIFPRPSGPLKNRRYPYLPQKTESVAWGKTLTIVEAWGGPWLPWAFSKKGPRSAWPPGTVLMTRPV